MMRLTIYRSKPLNLAHTRPKYAACITITAIKPSTHYIYTTQHT